MTTNDNSIPRRKTRQVTAGGLAIGGGAPVSVQSMTSLPVEQVEESIEQIQRMEAQGVHMVRCALRNEDSTDYFARLVKAVKVPLCADIHFNYRIALRAIDAGAAKIRINPGNIGSDDKVREVVNAARKAGVPLRIGVNGGSLDRKKYPQVTPENLVASALDHVRILEELDFHDTVISIKASDIHTTIQANQLLAAAGDWPIHLGLTEAGYGLTCIVQSSITLGHLLLQGIGDTIRVSMTGDPVEEVVIGKKILQTMGMAFNPLKVISCPTCGRSDPEIDLLGLAQSLESSVLEHFGHQLEQEQKSITLAVMGCEVNGPGESREADIGVAGARDGKLLIFARGEKQDIIHVSEAEERVIEEIKKLFSRS